MTKKSKQRSTASKKICWTTPALENLNDIADYLNPLNPRASKRISSEIKRQVKAISKYPQRAPIGREQGIRELVILHTPYIAAYRIKRSKIEIIAVFRHSQDWHLNDNLN